MRADLATRGLLIAAVLLIPEASGAPSASETDLLSGIGLSAPVSHSLAVSMGMAIIACGPSGQHGAGAG